MEQDKTLKGDCSVLFCDIRNFTRLFEERDPVEAIKFANSVLSVLGDQVEEMGGTVDRFTGDGFLAHFGLVDRMKNHRRVACQTALTLLQKLREINAERYFEVKSVVNFGIGIHAGVAAYGSIKTRHFSQNTVLGDVVNTASRIESLTKHFAVDILTSQDVAKHTKEHYDFQEMPPRDANGKENLITYWLLPVNEFK